MNVTLVDTEQGLKDAIAALKGAPRVACDIEADGLFRYRAKVCVLQLSTPEHAYVIDTMATWDAAIVQPVLGAEGPRKIIHDLSFDARLLREAGIALGHVQDTSIAARFLGEKSLGLGSLLASRLNVKVDKDRQKHDWSRRPLHQEDIDYLVGDVAHLFALADLLQGEASAREIVEEIALETDYMLARALVEPTPDPTPAWAKIKGAREQAPVVRSVLRELLAAREHEAKLRDVPPFKIVGEDSLIAASLKRPQGPDALTALGFRSAHARAAMNAWIAAIKAGIQRGDVPAEDLVEERQAPATREQRNRWKSRESALKSWRSAQAKARKLEPSVILPGHCLNDMVQLTQDSLDGLTTIAGLGAVRVARDGEAMLRALASAGSNGSSDNGGEPSSVA